MPENVREIVNGPNIIELFAAMTKVGVAESEIYFMEKIAGQCIIITSIAREDDSGHRFNIIGWIGYPRQNVKVFYDTDLRRGNWRKL
jgi:hypothetical protein